MTSPGRATCRGKNRSGTAAAAAAAAAAGLLAIAGCGSTPATGPAGASAPGIAGPALSTVVSASDGASWAVLDMGGAAATYNNFWELFVRPAGTGSWKLATPLGVASNGGIVAAATGPGSLLTGFRPSQDLTFSPLAATTDVGAQWTEGAVLQAGLADVPDALASSGGELLALTDAGTVELGSHLGASWTRLATQAALARAVRASCRLTGLTALGWSAAGAPIVAGSCGGATRTAGIFTLTDRTWRATGPELPAGLPPGPVSVLGLAVQGTRTTAVLAVGSGAATGLVAAWSGNGGSSWSLSPLLRTGAARSPAVSIAADGAASIVLRGREGVAIGWQTAGWQRLPALPAHTAVLTTTASGQPEALAVRAGTLTAWQLTAGPAGWQRLQTVQVNIPYGSSD
jgi:hypothetical protein